MNRMAGGFKGIAATLKLYLEGNLHSVEAEGIDLNTLVERLEAIAPGNFRSTSVEQIAKMLVGLAARDRTIRQLLAEARTSQPRETDRTVSLIRAGRDVRIGGDLVTGAKIIGANPQQESAQTEPATSRVFLSYASEDGVSVSNLAKLLKAAGIDVWIDNTELRGGQAWETAITERIAGCDRVVACLTQRFVDKFSQGKTFLRREIELALSRVPPGPEHVFLVPFCLEPCRLPEEMAHLHAITCTSEPQYDRLLEALRNRG
jgi:hypothetical protein